MKIYFTFYLYLNIKKHLINLINSFDGIPKNIHTVTKELFRMAVCLKPRLIQSGIERIQNIGNSEDMMPELLEKLGILPI